jgi:AcrR family transcriptional regulator
MARKQAVGSETSATRAALLDAAEALMRDKGYAAVTARRIGAAAGIRFQLVHYYFPTMEQLFLTLYRRHAERGLAEAAAALAGDDPIGAIWRQSSDSSHLRLHLEYMVLSNHQKSLRGEMAEHGEHLRRLQRDAYVRVLGEDRGPMKPETAILLLAGAGLILALEREQGMRFGHTEAEAFVAAALAEARQRATE